MKCNFHAHTNAWHGITNGKGTANDVYHMYDSMHYAIHCVSDYQSINRTYANTPGYIPAYEHGYNAGKTHQLVLGSNEVKWIDYLFPQTLSNKQHILNCLKSAGNAVVINHPLSFHGYRVSDFRFLSNYNCIEVLSPYANSSACWDTALSHGRPVFIAGNDDEHNIFSKKSLARMCTCINAGSTDRQTVLDAFKAGKSYGVRIGDHSAVLPVLNYLKLRGDSMFIKMSESARQISFIGQNGKLLQRSRNTSAATYVIKPNDHYIRTVIDYASGTSIFLNPVFRYNRTKKVFASFHINFLETDIKRMLGILILIIWARVAFSFVTIRSKGEYILRPAAFKELPVNEKARPREYF